MYIVDHRQHLQELEVEIEGTLAGKVLYVNFEHKTKLSEGHSTVEPYQTSFYDRGCGELKYTFDLLEIIYDT